MRHITDDLTVTQANQPPRPLHDLRIMGGIDESRAVSAIELFHHFEESGRRHRVEIRRGLIRQDQRRFADHGSRHRHPLLLSAGQLAGTTIFKAGETDFRKQLLHSVLCVARPAHLAGAR